MRKLLLIFDFLCYFSLGCSPFREWNSDSKKIMNFNHDHGKIYVRECDSEDPHPEIIMYVYAITDSIYPLEVRSYYNKHGYSLKSYVTLIQFREDLTIHKYKITIDTLFSRLYKWIMVVEDCALKIKQQDNNIEPANCQWKGVLFAYNTDVLIKDTNFDVPECCRMNLKDIAAFKNRIVKFAKRHHIHIGL